MKSIFDCYTEEELTKILGRLRGLLEAKKPIPEIKEILNKDKLVEVDELISIASAQLKNSKKKDLGEIKYFNESDLRFATPKDVAAYRAKRMSCNCLVELCCGIGIQTNAFSKVCKEVFAFEIDSRKVLYAKKNFPSRNIHFFCGDVLSNEVIEEVKKIKPDFIFCDPERMPSEEERNLGSIKPDIVELVKTYLKITPNLAIEVPPQISPDKLNVLGDFEREYTSYNKKLNRLTLYFGKLKKSSISVVDVSGARIEQKEIGNLLISDSPKNYIYEVSEGVLKAGLNKEFSLLTSTNQLSGCEKNKLLFTSEKLVKSPIIESFANSYFLLGVAKGKLEALKIIKQNRIGIALIKYSIDPAVYWKERKMYEHSLSGEGSCVLFKQINDLGEELILVCKEV
jgi:hypothetical protein